MITVFQDLSYGIRIMRRNPRFSLTLVFVLAIGIGGATTMFTMLYEVILQPLGFKNPERLVTLGAPTPPDSDALVWWNQSQTFESLCSYRSGGVNLTEGDWPSHIPAAVVSSDFFSVFAVTPQLGRSFVAEEETSGFNQVAILSDRLWANIFNRDTGIIGRNITLNGKPHSIIGVMPPTFSYPGHTDIWIPRVINGSPLNWAREDQPDVPVSLTNTMIGRLRAETNLTQARAALESLFVRLQEAYAQRHINFGTGIQIVALQEVLVQNYRPAFVILSVGVGLLLLIACANAVNLLLAHGATRRKEIAIRLSLGASPFRLIRQLLTESVLFAVMSGLVGVLFAYWGVGSLRAMGPGNIPRFADVRVNFTILGFALGLSLLVGVAVGSVPALQVLTAKFLTSLKEEGPQSSAGFHRYARNMMVVIEVALALVLVMGAGLSMQSFFRLTKVDPGFDPKNVVTMSIALPVEKYGKRLDASRVAGDVEKSGTGAEGANNQINLTQEPVDKNVYRAVDFHERLLESITHLSGITAVGGVNQLPLGSATSGKLWIEVPGTQGYLAIASTITGNYFPALGIPLLTGRSFTEKDSQSTTPVVIITEKLAQLIGEGQNLLGHSLLIGGESKGREIVGVVGDVKHIGLTKETEPQFYLPYRQPFRGSPPPLNMTLVVRTVNPSPGIINSMQSLIMKLDKDLPAFRIKTMDEVISESTSDFSFRGALMGSFAMLALGLAVIGVYGVVAYSVRLRTREIGVRMSLGASPQDILLMILREGTFLALIGVMLGVALTFWLNRFIANLLYGIGPVDYATFSVAIFALLAGTLLGCALPALAASKVEPATALKQN